jgi:hypothetical protein
MFQISPNTSLGFSEGFLPASLLFLSSFFGSRAASISSQLSVLCTNTSAKKDLAEGFLVQFADDGEFT